MSYYFSKFLGLPFDDAVLKVIEELKKEGFGIITEIDVKETLKKKLNVDYDNYVILGVCNPPFAYKALQAEKEIGLLLPCNVIVYSQDNEVIVSAVDIMEAMSMVKNEKIDDISFSNRSAHHSIACDGGLRCGYRYSCE